MTLCLTDDNPALEPPEKRRRLDEESKGKDRIHSAPILLTIDQIPRDHWGRDNTSIIRSGARLPPEDIAEALGLYPLTFVFCDDYLRAFTDVFASSELGRFNSKLDLSPGARFPIFPSLEFGFPERDPTGYSF